MQQGGSKAEAARRFQVGEASVYRWLKPDGLSFRKPGSTKPRTLDWVALRRHVEQFPDQTQKERARHFAVSRHCIWHALRQMNLTRKKRRSAIKSATRNSGKAICGDVSV